MRGVSKTAITVVALLGGSVQATVQSWISCRHLQQTGQLSSSGVQTLTRASSTFSTYCDATTDGGGWTLVAYASQAQLNQPFQYVSSDWQPTTRTNAAAAPATQTIFQESVEVAVSWSASGFPTGDISSYDAAVSWTLPNATAVDFSGATWGVVKSCSDQPYQLVPVTTLQGNPNLAPHMYTGNYGKISGGRAFGLVSPFVSGLAACDWNIDTSPYVALYVRLDTSSNWFGVYPSPGGLANQLIPSTVAVWTRPLTNAAPTISFAGGTQMPPQGRAAYLTNPIVLWDDAESTFSGIQVTATCDNSAKLKLWPGSNLASVTGDGTSSLSITGSVAAIRYALANVQFTGAALFHSSATCTFTVNDNGSGRQPAAAYQTATLTINFNVQPVNEPPTLSATTTVFNIVEDTTQSLTVSIADPDITGSNLNRPISVNVTAWNGLVSFATTVGLTLAQPLEWHYLFRGTLANLNAALTNMVFSPYAHYFGPASVTVSVNDEGWAVAGSQSTQQAQTAFISLLINVTSTNDAPVISGVDITTQEDTPVAIPLNATDVDLGQHALTVTLQVSHGSLQFTQAPGVQASFANNKYTLVGLQQDLNRALSGLMYTPTADWSGSDTLVVTATDSGWSISGGRTDPKTVTRNIVITVTPVNDAPRIAGSGITFWVDRTSTLRFTSISVTDPDAAPSDVATVVITALHGLLSIDSAAPVSVTGSRTDQTQLRFTGTLSNINAALSTLSYRNTLTFNFTVMHVKDRVFDQEGVSIDITDAGSPPATGHAALQVIVTTAVYPTCTSFLQTYPAYCGCYFVSSNTHDHPERPVVWATLPIDFPSEQFLQQDGTNRNPTVSYVQGCCATYTNAERTAKFDRVQQIGLCKPAEI
eukprot:TRINITY_DN3827_c0_g1_i1.p1 TRINITY_DN3827_c0_g1~~TRINITY_DN3827_c0_g1_i1.p1  ORF type:complete len:875 (+),score=125.18 TRINITY_DN3827_c0_g1_i1:101-2725(+)